MEWVSRYATTEPLAVLDIGGRNINGSPRHLFPAAEYTVLDAMSGPDVDIVADAATWTPDREYDMVLCLEVCEHTEVWPQIVATAYKACRTGGQLVLTCAGPGRAPHNASDGGPLPAGEYYQNLPLARLHDVLVATGWQHIRAEQLLSDLRAVATK